MYGSRIRFNILADFHMANNTVHAPNRYNFRNSYTLNSYFVYVVFRCPSHLLLLLISMWIPIQLKLWQIVHAKMCACLFVVCTMCTFHRRKHKSSGKFGEKLIIERFKTCYVVMNERRMNHNKDWCNYKVTIANQEPKTKKKI